MLEPKIGFCVTIHPHEEGTEFAPQLAQEGMRALQAGGMKVVSAPEIIQDDRTSAIAAEAFAHDDVDLICVIPATWTADYLVTDILRTVDVPVITWAQPGINTGSLCGSQQINCVLKELGKICRFVYGPPDDSEVVARVSVFARAASLLRELHLARLGLVGYRIPGMTEVAFDELELRQVFGPRVVHIGVEELLGIVSCVSKDRQKLFGVL